MQNGSIESVRESSRYKRSLLVYKNIDLKKIQNLHFSKEVSPWVLPPNLDFSLFCFNAKVINKKCLVRF